MEKERERKQIKVGINVRKEEISILINIKKVEMENTKVMKCKRIERWKKLRKGKLGKVRDYVK